ncbi:uncharacterized protein DUF2752 [Winogradskyella eximia]|jgi:Protein of unknown function (DUF2752)|uniref:Uncharacterized protein DUF2752 n=1 Tax=Winogradskyella eximia TaxID=262006 RepID=A0A3D9H247_9FLAO|nr:DUF2752 domain-containing protein [Winogradskyella eximia]RED43564.1 uncharacterized protein DUF2752 [Winogradskyella eximia]|tara:strand:- start:825 stop:1124 length:300 start_codon:yes stop_codon:yes gene_type:complete
MLILAKGIEDYMLPCLNKKYLGFECMGCGLQRSVALILKGQFVDAFIMYPAIYSIIALFGFIIINSFKNYKSGTKIITILAVANVAIIIGSFLLKLYFK